MRVFSGRTRAVLFHIEIQILYIQRHTTTANVYDQAGHHSSQSIS